MAKAIHRATFVSWGHEGIIELSIRQPSEELRSMARMGWIFTVLIAFSICGFFAVILGYDLFHATNPSGLLGISFLVLGIGTLFLGLHLFNAFTDPLPAWYTYFQPTSFREPETDRPKRQLFIVYASTYLAMMAGLIAIFIGRLSLEDIALPLGIGLLTFLLLTSLLGMFTAFRMIGKKDGKISSSGDKAS